MRVSIICVGHLSREYQQVWRHYELLLRPYVKLEVLEAPESPLALGERQARAREGSGLMSLLSRRAGQGAFTVAVDGRGKQYSSKELSTLLATKKLEGHSRFRFLLGGAMGLDGQVLRAAEAHWSLSRLTFPHQMARCMVIEQLYRAIRIERGEPYHH